MPRRRKRVELGGTERWPELRLRSAKSRGWDDENSGSTSRGGFPFEQLRIGGTTASRASSAAAISGRNLRAVLRHGNCQLFNGDHLHIAEHSAAFDAR
jgi:hypothetical protein